MLNGKPSAACSVCTCVRNGLTRPYAISKPARSSGRHGRGPLSTTGRSISGDFAQRVEGPSGVELVSAAANTAIDASVRSSYAAFSSLLTDWTGRVKRWRCGLSAAERLRLGVGANWRCDDVRLFIDRVNFEQLGPARAGVLNAVPTRFVLPAEQVELLIEGGADALR